MNFDEALAYLLSLGHETLTIKLGLRNTETLLAGLGNPHREFPAVQIAGTNGKGSTAEFLDSICRAAGIRTGLFTSPHLVSITERIRIDGEHISETDFARFTAEVKTVAEDLVQRGKLETLPTFFEHLTAIALLRFRAAKIDLAILETGLGGRLDSTTAARANIIAITPIAMDHEEYLGNSLKEIAAEKAAIIHAGVYAVIAPQPPDALEVILRQCEATNVSPTFAGNSIEVIRVTDDGRFVVAIESSQGRYEDVRLGLRGRHQIQNAEVAVALAEKLRESDFEITRESIIAGLESATHAGRLELSEGPPKVLFDGAHNPAAAQTLRDYLDEFVTSPVTMVFGAMRDKRIPQMAAVLFPRATDLVLTEIDNPRAASIEALKAVVPKGFNSTRVHEASSVKEAIETAEANTPANGLICVTGSLYLVGAAQQILRARGRS